MRTCLDCGDELAADEGARRRYCSACRKVRARASVARLGTEPTSRDCVACGWLFVPRRSDSRTCSRICADVLRADTSSDRRRVQASALHSHGRATAIGWCGTCRASFNRGSSKRRYCSDDCHDIADLWAQHLLWETKRRSRRPRNCALCDAQFTPKRDASQFCSRTCSMRYWGQQGVTRRRRLVGDHAGVTPAEWAALLSEFGHRCAYCNAAGPLTQDHVVPLVAGGRHEPGNVVPACQPCNSAKRSQPLAVWLGFTEPRELA